MLPRPKVEYLESEPVSRFIDPITGTLRPETVQRRIEAILRELAPAQSPDQRFAVHRAGQHIQGTLNLSSRFPRRELALCQGKLYEAAPDWWKPGSGTPDGSYAIIRGGRERSRGGQRPRRQPHALALPRTPRPLRRVELRARHHHVRRPLRLRAGGRALGGVDRHARPRPVLQPPPPPAPPSSGTARLDKAAWTLAVDAPPIRSQMPPQPGGAPRGPGGGAERDLRRFR